MLYFSSTEATEDFCLRHVSLSHGLVDVTYKPWHDSVQFILEVWFKVWLLTPDDDHEVTVHQLEMQLEVPMCTRTQVSYYFPLICSSGTCG
jgi:hypothetical protein